MLLNEIATNSSNTFDAVMSLARYVTDNYAPKGFTSVIKTLMTAYPQARYKGTMRRFMAAPIYTHPKDIRELTSMMHRYVVNENNQRRFFGWSTLTPSNLFDNLALQDKTVNIWLCVEQDYFGLDVEHCLQAAWDNFDGLYRDRGESSDDEYMYEAIQDMIGEALDIAATEKEILASFSNDVHVAGVVVHLKFYDTDHLADAFRAMKNKNNDDSIIDSVIEVCNYIAGGEFHPTMLPQFLTINRLISTFSQAKYNGPMHRLIKLPDHVTPVRMQEVTSAVDNLRNKTPHQFYLWSTLHPQDLANTFNERGRLICIEQNHIGLDLEACLSAVLHNSEKYPKLMENNGSMLAFVEEMRDTAREHQAIIAQYSRNVGVVGVVVDQRFYNGGRMLDAFRKNQADKN